MTDNAWNQAEDLAEKHANQGGLFIRLPNHGDKVVGAFCGEPYAREVHWTGERYEECTGEGCSICGTGKKPSLRVMLNFYVPAEGGMKVYEHGTRVFKDVLKLRGKYGLGTWLFEIERHGEAGSNKTRYSILPEAKIDDELQARIDAEELNDLASFAGDKSTDSKPMPAAASTDSASGVIPPDSAGRLVGRLKSLPRSDVDTFLARFGISRVRDLQVSDAQAAAALLADLEAKQAPAPASGDIDPFA